MYDDCVYQGRYNKCWDVPQHINQNAVHVWRENHFAFVYVDIQKQIIKVEEGMLKKETLKNWLAHGLSILAMRKLINDPKDLHLCYEDPLSVFPEKRTCKYDKEYEINAINRFLQRFFL
jgi:hypothetical protein